MLSVAEAANIIIYDSKANPGPFIFYTYSKLQINLTD